MFEEKVLIWFDVFSYQLYSISQCDLKKNQTHAWLVAASFCSHIKLLFPKHTTSLFSIKKSVTSIYKWLF
jgi:hypothetical protein